MKNTLTYYLVFIALAVFVSTKAIGQSTGINNTSPNTKAALDVKSTSSYKQGFLMPRLAGSDTSNIGVSAGKDKGLVFYDTTNNVFRFWTGSKWTGISTSSGSSYWTLTGNSGTVDGTNFIGTTDNVPFNIQVNGQKSGRIDPTNANTFFGYQSGNVITNGYGNTANGSRALQFTTSGNYNTSIGMVALHNTTSGSNNTASGQNALNANTTGSSNTANGMYALLTNSIGSFNTGVGYSADVSTTNLSYATAIGANATVGCSNCMVLGGTGASVVNVGIGMGTPAHTLDVTGSSTGTVVNLANSTNTGGTVLTTSITGGSGAATYYGISTSASASGGTTYGLYATANGSGTSYGVYGTSTGASGYGVYGTANGNVSTGVYGSAIGGNNSIGVSGISTSGGTLGYGVFGSSLGSYGGYFENSAATKYAALGGQTYSGVFMGGNVGIGTNTPAYTLDVTGSARITGLAGSGTSLIQTDASGLLSRYSGTALTGTGSANTVAFWNGTNTLSYNTNFSWDNTNTRLGIGTTTPAYTLDVTGDMNLGSTSNVYRIGGNEVVRFVVDVSNGNSIMLGGAGSATSTGYKNVLTGYLTGYSITNGNNNTFIGYATGYSTTTGYGNTFVGSQTGSLNYVGNNNTAIGYSASVNDGLTNATAIGANAIAGASNTLILGNGVNVGIGITTPIYLLTVSGSLALTGNGGESYTVFNSPSQMDGSLTYTLPSTQGASGSTLSNDGTGTLSWATASNSNPWTSSGSYIYPTTLTNYVGIGTTSPSALLEISLANANVVSEALRLANVPGGTGGTFMSFNTGGNEQSAIGGWYDGTTNQTLAFFTTNGHTERMRITGTGNVGIGTSNPAYTLDVTGSARITSLAGPGTVMADANGVLSVSTTTSSSPWTSSGTNIYPTTLTNYVGIGTNNPQNTVQVGSTNPLFLVTSNLPDPCIGFNAYVAPGWIWQTASAGYGAFIEFSASSGNLTIMGSSASSAAGSNAQFTNPAITVTPGPNVGIGTSSPSSVLHVVSSTSPGLTLQDGTQAAGAFLVSNSTGGASWAKSYYNTHTTLNQGMLSPVTTTPQNVNIGTFTFTKNYANSILEANFNSYVAVGSFSGAAGVFLTINVNGVTPTGGTFKFAIQTQSSNPYLSCFSVFSGIPAGSCTVTVTASTLTGTCSSILIDSGGFGGTITVKETF